MKDVRDIKIQLSEEISFVGYLKTMMDENAASEFIQQLDSIRKGEGEKELVVVTGPLCPTGKSTLCGILKELGYPVLEGYQVASVVLDKNIHMQTVRLIKEGDENGKIV